ncbi:putative neuropeptide Y receptor 11 [Gigantopelta aegis]|uniref:putative neuropeptide Y receptor 11 n=1 Tax=Gigantopelta aegis TaxID=1735272 RepID=UPI001B88D13D|nr:putative neuropeptide Y receptor 11 [Gigantopelta aegis]
MDADDLQSLEEQNIVTWPAIFYAGIILPFSVIGNAAVILVFFLNFKPSATRSFILAIGFFSLGLGAVALPVEIYSLFHMYTFPHDALCKSYVFVEIFCTFGSAAVLLVVAIHRYKKICQPFKVQMTLTMARILRAIVCVLALVLALPTFILYGTKTVEIPGTRLRGKACGIENDFKGSFYITIYHYMFLTVFVGGGVTIAVLYTLVAKKVLLLLRCKCKRVISHDNYNNVIREMMQTVKKRTESQRSDQWAPKRTSGRSDGSRRRRSIAQSKRTTSMLAVTTLVIFVSFLPSLIIRTTEEFNFDLISNMSVTEQMVYHVFLRSYYFHCAASPIIYGAFNAKFRHELRALLLNRHTGGDVSV